MEIRPLSINCAAASRLSLCRLSFVGTGCHAAPLPLLQFHSAEAHSFSRPGQARLESSDIFIAVHGSDFKTFQSEHSALHIPSYLVLSVVHSSHPIYPRFRVYGSSCVTIINGCGLTAV